jgi:hypothetical protein
VIGGPQMTSLECAQYILDEFGHGGRAILVQVNGPVEVMIKRDGQPDVRACGLFAVELIRRLSQEARHGR